MKNDKISIIVPVYNIRGFLNATLESVIRQTYTNLEIILIDDGSTDGSGEICDLWEKKDSRIKSFHKKNEGVSVARNFGFEKSTGDYIMFVDGDDEISSDMCEKMLNQLVEKQGDMSYCGYANVFLEKTLRYVPKDQVLIDGEILWALYESLSFFSAIWNKLFKRTMLLDENENFVKFSPDIHMSEDYLWLTKVLKKAHKAAAVPEVLYYWKRRQDSATGGKNSNRTDEKYLSTLKAHRAIIDEVEDVQLKIRFTKNYLALVRDCLVQAYRENKKELTDYLINIIIKDRVLYNKFDLFIIKLKICMFLIKIKVPVGWLDIIQKI